MEEKEYQKWEKETNKECYLNFLKEFQISHLQFKKQVGLDGLKLLLDQKFFLFIYGKDPGFSEAKNGTIEIQERKPMVSEEKETLLAYLFGTLLQKEAQRLATLWQLDWEDLHQEAEIDFLENRGSFDLKRGANLLTYYKMRMRSRALDLARKEKRHSAFPLEEMKFGKKVKEPSTSLDLTNIELKLILKKLTPKQREVVELKLKNLTLKKIAKELGISVDSVKDRFEGIKKKLQDTP